MQPLIELLLLYHAQLQEPGKTQGDDTYINKVCSRHRAFAAAAAALGRAALPDEEEASAGVGRAVGFADGSCPGPQAVTCASQRAMTVQWYLSAIALSAA